MSELSLDPATGLTFDSAVLGVGKPADCTWTSAEFAALCQLLLNENDPHEFLLTYCDKQGVPRFAKSKTQIMRRRATWAWDTIIGKAKSKVGLGFYPSNQHGCSRWAAIDFDAHDGDAERARRLAQCAFAILHRKTTLRLILATSGSAGWHLFVFAHDFHQACEWSLLLRKVAAEIGAELKPGICELFPADARIGVLPRGIRAPGTWNPKTDQLGLMLFESIKPLLAKDISAVREPARRSGGSVDPIPVGRFYTGGAARWLEQFAITRPSTRHVQLEALVYTVFRQVGRSVGQRLAEEQYNAAAPQPNGTLADHLIEFGELWAWTEKQWRSTITSAEIEILDGLDGSTQRDLFRILWNFARLASARHDKAFSFPIEHVAQRLGVSYQHISKLRQLFAAKGFIQLVEGAVVNRQAARFRWCCALETPIAMV